MSDFEVLASPSSTFSASGPPVSPKQRLFFYPPGEWEEFIREWVSALRNDYVKVKRMGGTGDEGIDVAGFKSDAGFEGAWDCYQCKHYAAALSPSNVYPELLKMFLHVVADDYQMPDEYSFLAPRGCGSMLSKLILKPSKFRSGFVNKCEEPWSATAGLDPSDLNAVIKLANQTDFSMFKSVELHEVLKVHETTRHHVARFGGPLKPRPSAPSPPLAVAASEARYVEQLVEAYAEVHPAEISTVAAAASHPDTGDHFKRQRINFYSAEALRVYARDSVPVGTFEALQQDIHDGVVDVAESHHDTGLDRLRGVLVAAAQVDLASHVIVQVSNTRDRHGICHQLANVDRLRWVPAP
ncbi:MAG: ABC-three component system protein [Microthrixaceae bacterium]